MEQGKEALKNFLHAIAPSDSKNDVCYVKVEVDCGYCNGTCELLNSTIFIFLSSMNIISYHLP